MSIIVLQANEALQSIHGKNYTIGNAKETVTETVSGGGIDYAKGELEIPYAYTIELRGKHGFILPKDQIIPTGEEVMAFHVAAAMEIINEFAS